MKTTNAISDVQLQKLQEWAKKNFDTTLVLAIATETPRWTVVFTALHEPAWIGVTMGVLISWAAKRGWNAWNKQRNRHGLFALNVWVLASAVAIMSPVLLEMTKHPIEEVSVSDALLQLHQYAVWLWVLLVAQSTFMPLIQAVVAHDVPVQAPAPINAIVPVTPKIAPVNATIATGEDASAQPLQSEAAKPENAIVADIKARYLQLRKQGVAHKDAIESTGAKSNTALSWWNRAKMQMQAQGGD